MCPARLVRAAAVFLGFFMPTKLMENVYDRAPYQGSCSKLIAHTKHSCCSRAENMAHIVDTLAVVVDASFEPLP